MRKRTVAVLAVAFAVVAGPPPGAITDYYEGKNVTYIVATNAGGGPDSVGVTMRYGRSRIIPN